MPFQLLVLLLSFLAFFSDSGGGEEEDDENPGDRDGDGGQGDPDDEDDDALDDKGKKALRSEREARRAAEKKRREAEKRLAALEKKQREADAAAAKEAGDFKKLYEELQEKFDGLEAERETERIQAARERAARKHQIPDDLVDLIQGDEEKDIEASAKKLAKHVNPAAVDTEAGSGRRGQTNSTKGSPRQLDDPPKDTKYDAQPSYPFLSEATVIINE